MDTLSYFETLTGRLSWTRSIASTFRLQTEYLLDPSLLQCLSCATKRNQQAISTLVMGIASARSAGSLSTLSPLQIALGVPPQDSTHCPLCIHQETFPSPTPTDLQTATNTASEPSFQPLALTQSQSLSTLRKLYYSSTSRPMYKFLFQPGHILKKKKDKTPNLGLGALNSTIQDVFAPVDDLSLQHMAPAESFMDWQPAAASAGSGGTKSLTHMPALRYLAGLGGGGRPHSLCTGFLLSAQEHSSFGKESGGDYRVP